MIKAWDGAEVESECAEGDVSLCLCQLETVGCFGRNQRNGGYQKVPPVTPD